MALDFNSSSWGSPSWDPNTVNGPDTAYSAPSIAEMSNSETAIGVEGAADSLDVYFDGYGTPGWPENVVAGPRATYSTPLIAVPKLH
jgi:hypothetical protein